MREDLTGIADIAMVLAWCVMLALPLLRRAGYGSVTVKNVGSWPFVLK